MVCGGALECALELPRLPLTDTFTREPVVDPFPDVDQALLHCGSCGHGQAAVCVPAEILYGSRYRFRTSLSATARKGTEFFLGVLEEVARGRRFRSILDLGCNDLYLLKRLAGLADLRVGIDPVWRGREAEANQSGVTVIGAEVEELDLAGVLPCRPDLVVCRHTLEHIRDPAAVLRTLFAASAPDALFLIEVPAFEALLARYRFDQVFHQHLQYFSRASFRRLLLEGGAEHILHREHYHDWGALVVAFRKGRGRAAGGEDEAPALSAIRERYALFRRQMASTRAVLDSLRGTPVYGYGAAQMLPVLAYHLEDDLGGLEAILDDDPEKEGLRYWNLPVEVRRSSTAPDLSAASVLITAVDSVGPILQKLLAARPRHIVYPFHIL